MQITSEHDTLPHDRHLDWICRNDGRTLSTKFAFFWKDRPEPALAHIEIIDSSGGRSRHLEYSASIIDTKTGIPIAHICDERYAGGGSRFASPQAARSCASKALAEWRTDPNTSYVRISPNALERINLRSEK